MKFKAKKKDLESILSLCSAYTDKKDATNIASYFLLTTSMNTLEIKANDFEMGIKYLLSKNLEVESEGKVCVNAKKLIERIKPLKNEDLTLELKDGFFYIKQGKSTSKLAIFDDLEFASLPSTKDKDKFDISSDVLNLSLSKISAPIDTNHQRYALRGAFLDIKNDHINFVSTDIQRLAIYTLAKQTDHEFSMCIPKRAIQAMKELFYDGKVELFYDKQNLIAKSDKYKFYTKLINDTFPDYERIIPKNIKQSFSLPTDEVKDALKLIAASCENIKLSFFKNKLVFQSKDISELTSTEVDLDLALEEEFSIFFKIKFLNDFLNTIEEESFELLIIEPETPFVVKSGELRTIIAPLLN